MNAGFNSRQLASPADNLGEELRRVRINQGLSLADCAYKLKLKSADLEALETENYELLPAGFYGLNIFKRYVSFLGLNERRLSRVFLTDRRLSAGAGEAVFSKKVVRRRELWILPRFLRNFLIAAAVIICFAYLALYFNRITTPPSLEILKPTANISQKELNFVIEGRTDPESEVTINNQGVLINQDGSFSQAVSLRSGVNLLIIKAKKKYSHERAVTRQILVE